MTDVSTTRTREASGWAIGWIFFAAFMMIMIGTFHLIAGMAGIFEDEFYTVTPNYIFEFDTTTWGWIHVILGVIVLFSGIYLFTGAVLARIVGVIMAIVSAIVGFAWLPFYPVWGIVIVAIAISVIWALTAHGRDIADD